MRCKQMVLVRCWLLLLFSLSAFGDVLSLLERHRSSQADFSKVVMSPNGAVLDRSYGQMRMMAPDFLRWQEEHGEEVIVNQDRVYLYRANLNQVQVSKVDEMFKHTPAGLLLAPSKRLLKDYKVDEQKFDDEIFVTMVPLKLEGFVRQFKLRFNAGKLTRFELTDWQHNIVYLEFYNLNFNKTPTAEFDFAITPGMEVIK